MPSWGVPECLVERLSEFVGFVAERAASVGLAERGVDLGDLLLGGIRVALRLDQRDRPLCQGAVGVHDCVLGVLPAVIEQTSE